MRFTDTTDTTDAIDTSDDTNLSLSDILQRNRRAKGFFKKPFFNQAHNIGQELKRILSHRMLLAAITNTSITIDVDYLHIVLKSALPNYDDAFDTHVRNILLSLIKTAEASKETFLRIIALKYCCYFGVNYGISGLLKWLTLIQQDNMLALNVMANTQKIAELKAWAEERMKRLTTPKQRREKIVGNHYRLIVEAPLQIKLNLEAMHNKLQLSALGPTVAMQMLITPLAIALFFVPKTETIPPALSILIMCSTVLVMFVAAKSMRNIYQSYKVKPVVPDELLKMLNTEYMQTLDFYLKIVFPASPELTTGKIDPGMPSLFLQEPEWYQATHPRSTSDMLASLPPPKIKRRGQPSAPPAPPPIEQTPAALVATSNLVQSDSSEITRFSYNKREYEAVLDLKILPSAERGNIVRAFGNELRQNGNGIKWNKALGVFVIKPSKYETRVIGRMADDKDTVPGTPTRVYFNVLDEHAHSLKRQKK